MKNVVLIGLLVLSARLYAQQAIPGGTILPVQLNSSVKTDKARPGQSVIGRIMQDVPLSDHSSIRCGAKVIGHIIAVRPASNRSGAEISLRFDTVAIGTRRIAVVTNLRALAAMMEVSEAQVPESGPDRGTSEYSWTTDQIGGEVNYHAGSTVFHYSEAVGRSVPGGVLVRVNSRPGSNCRGNVEGNDRPQALWVFSSDACGLYGFPNLILAHAGRTTPIGQITLMSSKGDLNVRAGGGMLLRVNSAMQSFRK